MEKKNYVSPQLQQVDFTVETHLLVGSVTSDNGLGYGGEDYEGGLEPQSIEKETFVGYKNFWK